MWSNKEEAACAKSQGQTHLNANSNNRSARRTCGLTTTYKWNHLPLYSQSSWIVYRNALTWCSKLTNCLDGFRVQLADIKKWSHVKKTQLNSDECNLEFAKETFEERIDIFSMLHPTCLLIDSMRQHIDLLICDFSGQASQSSWQVKTKWRKTTFEMPGV